MFLLNGKKPCSTFVLYTLPTKLRSNLHFFTNLLADIVVVSNNDRLQYTYVLKYVFLIVIVGHSIFYTAHIIYFFNL